MAFVSYVMQDQYSDEPDKISYTTEKTSQKFNCMKILIDLNPPESKNLNFSLFFITFGFIF